MTSEQTQELAAALAKAQGQMTAAKFNRTNPHFKNKYADLSAIIEAVRKPLSDNGLSVTQAIEINGGGALVLVTTLRHSSGQWTDSHYPLPMNAKPQEFGSALTYAKRYSLSSLVCISADEDDDAEIAQRIEPHVNGNGSGKLNQMQIDFLRSAIVEAGADIKKLCDYFKVKRIEDIHANRLDAVNTMLAEFRKQQAAKQQAAGGAA